MRNVASAGTHLGLPGFRRRGPRTAGRAGGSTCSTTSPLTSRVERSRRILVPACRATGWVGDRIPRLRPNVRVVRLRRRRTAGRAWPSVRSRRGWATPTRRWGRRSTLHSSRMSCERLSSSTRCSTIRCPPRNVLLKETARRGR